MKILICNVGSNSLKYQLFDMDDNRRVVAAGRAERVGAPNSAFSHSGADGRRREETLPLPTHREAISHMLRNLVPGDIPSLGDISCVGFKVVHAQGVTGVQFLTEPVLRAMEAYNSIAPAHNPPYIAAIRQFRELLPGIPLIGSFETGFHAKMPPEAYLYSIPAELSRKYGIRRYGFHGASTNMFPITSPGKWAGPT
jgi:acetate kinase